MDFTSLKLIYNHAGVYLHSIGVKPEALEELHALLFTCRKGAKKVCLTACYLGNVASMYWPKSHFKLPQKIYDKH